MKILIVLLIYLTSTWGEPNYCCPNDPDAVIFKSRCPDGKESIARKLCGSSTPVLLPRNMLGENYTVDGSDNLILGEDYLPKDQ